MNNCCGGVKVSPPDCPIRSLCPDKYGCTAGICPDFIVKQHDTMPSFKFLLEDENGDPVNLSGLVVEASMWLSTRLKKDISATDTTLIFQHDLGFYTSLVDDIIQVDRERSPEQMRIVDFDENARTVIVERGVNGTTASAYKKHTGLKMFRFISSPASTEMVIDDLTQIDGTTLCDQLVSSYLVYDWTARDTCLRGCYCFSFKTLKMQASPTMVVPTPSIIPVCFLGVGVEWARSYPVCGNFLIKVCESPVVEL